MTNVKREGGSCGEIRIKWKTDDDTALQEHDYIHEMDQEITFAHGNVCKHSHSNGILRK